MIDIRNLFFSYNRVPPYLLEDINLHIGRGDYVSILGENGSGKSTLVKLMLNTVKHYKGIISVGTNRIGYVPQRFDNFNSQFPITVFEILKSHMIAVKIKDNEIINKSLQMVGMEKYRNSLIGNLSGGQQQKIFIARALMGNPELLILDEPSTGVDIQSQKEIYGIIKKLNRDMGVTVIAIEHNLRAAILNSSHIFELDNGKGSLYSAADYKHILEGVAESASI